MHAFHVRLQTLSTDRQLFDQRAHLAATNNPTVLRRFLVSGRGFGIDRDGVIGLVLLPTPAWFLGLPLAVIALGRLASPRLPADLSYGLYIYSFPLQQVLADSEGLYTGHPDVKYPPDRPKLSDLNLLRTDPEELEKRNEEIKTRFVERCDFITSPGFLTGAKPVFNRSATADPKMKPRLSIPTTRSTAPPRCGAVIASTAIWKPSGSFINVVMS